MIDWLIDFPTQHPTLTGWFTSLVSVSVLVNFLVSYWKRPIIWARLHAKYRSLADVPFRDPTTGQVCDATYLRLSLKNRGRTRLKECSATVIDVTVRQKGERRQFFNQDPWHLGWSNEAAVTKYDLRPKRDHTVDIAVLLKGAPSRLYWHRPNNPTPADMPATLYNFLSPLSTAPGKTRYIFRVSVDAENENVRSRKVPVEFLFDPTRAEFRFVPFSTRWPGWRQRRWLRAKLGLY